MPFSSFKKTTSNTKSMKNAMKLPGLNGVPLTPIPKLSGKATKADLSKYGAKRR